MEERAARPDRGPTLGSRVVVRHALAEPDPRTGATLTDVVGDLVAQNAAHLVVRTRRGVVEVPRHLVTAFKEIPPTPSRRGSPHRALSVEDLQRVMVGAWPAMETERLGDWVLRASRGFTQRANSVVTAGSPGVPLPTALDAVEHWYAARGLPANLTLAGPVGFDPASDAVGAEALRRGYRGRTPTVTLTAPARLIATHPPQNASTGAVAVAVSPEVAVGEVLTDAWFAAYRAYREVDDVAARAVLTGSPRQVFATATDAGGRVVGIGRLALASAWGGIAAMWVDPAVRRQGVGAHLLTALARAADGAGAGSLHLQTDSDNTPALALYERRGFERHHEYVNLTRPAP